MSKNVFTLHRENRYLLFLTENYAALQVLKHYLYEEVGMKTTNEISFLEEPESSHHRTEPFFLFEVYSLKTENTLKYAVILTRLRFAWKLVVW